MRVILELIRIIFIFGIVGAFCSAVLVNVYENFGFANDSYIFLGSVAILILLFVLYRNKLQFSGWFQGKGRQKLPKRVTQVLLVFSIGMLAFPALLQAWNYLLGT